MTSGNCVGRDRGGSVTSILVPESSPVYLRDLLDPDRRFGGTRYGKDKDLD